MEKDITQTNWFQLIGILIAAGAAFGARALSEATSHLKFKEFFQSVWQGIFSATASELNPFTEVFLPGVLFLVGAAILASLVYGTFISVINESKWYNMALFIVIGISQLIGLLYVAFLGIKLILFGLVVCLSILLVESLLVSGYNKKQS